MSELCIELTNRGIDPDVVTDDEMATACEAVGATGIRSDIPRIADHIATRHYRSYQEAMDAAQGTYRYHTINERQAERRGYRPVTRSVEWVAQFVPNDGDVITLYTSFGHIPGRESEGEQFQTERIRRNGDRLEVFVSDGRTVAAYPLGQGRTIRTLITDTEVAA